MLSFFREHASINFCWPCHTSPLWLTFDCPIISSMSILLMTSLQLPPARKSWPLSSSSSTASSPLHLLLRLCPIWTPSRWPETPPGLARNPKPTEIRSFAGLIPARTCEVLFCFVRAATRQDQGTGRKCILCRLFVSAIDVLLMLPILLSTFLSCCCSRHLQAFEATMTKSMPSYPSYLVLTRFRSPSFSPPLAKRNPTFHPQPRLRVRRPLASAVTWTHPFANIRPFSSPSEPC